VVDAERIVNGCAERCVLLPCHIWLEILLCPTQTPAMSQENILGTLVVVVLKGQHLIDNHTFYKQDPYAKLTLSGATKQTPVDPKGGQHPVWDAELRFPISKDPSKSNRTLTVSVYSEEKKDDSFLGEGTVDITNTLKTGEFDGISPFLSPGLSLAKYRDRLGTIESEGHSAWRGLS
jgi:Ca2+-dependent lipid-binding protein